MALLSLGGGIFACRHSSPPDAAPQILPGAEATAVLAPPEGVREAPAHPRRGPVQLLSMDFGLSREEAWAAWNSLRGDSYELDPIRRFLDDGEKPDCKSQALVRHAGKALRYSRAVHVNPSFRERLLRFEEIVVEVARDTYGRAPARLQHAGAFSCRSSRQRSYRLSEHALGNAIDVVGFDFDRATRRDSLPPALSPALKRPFQVRVARHWEEPEGAGSAAAATHVAFLRALADRLEQRHDVFRGMIGPSHRDHSDHFHFDMAPWRYVHF